MKRVTYMASLRFRRWLQRKIPAGIAAGPFEFAVAVGYLVVAVRILVDGRVYETLKVALFPHGGLMAWTLLLLASTTAIVAGQLMSARSPLSGLGLERAGLIFLACDLAGYLYAVWARTGGVSAAVETVGATLLACLYKAAMINTALYSSRKAD